MYSRKCDIPKEDIELFDKIQPLTLSGSPISPIEKGFPKKTLSLCPECLSIIPATQYENDGKVLMDKECTEHGIFKDIISSDVKILMELEKWYFRDGKVFSDPQVSDASV